MKLTQEQSKLATKNIPLMNWWLSNILPCHPNLKSYLDEDELSSGAYYGLIKAARYFDPKKGFKFSALFNRIIYTTLAEAGRKDATYTDHYKQKKLEFFHKVEAKPEPLEIEESDTNIKIKKCLGKIKDSRYRIILEGRFWKRMSLSDLGNELGISKERVRQIETKALNLFKGIYCGNTSNPC